MDFYRCFLPILFLLGIVLGLQGCQKPVVVERETASLLEADRAFAETSVREGAPAAFREFLTGEALQFTGTGNVIRGNQQIYKQMSAAMDSSIVLDWEPEEGEVSISGDFGYTWGRYTVYKKVSGMGSDSLNPLSEGVYVNVWKKQPDGSWKVVVDIGNSKNNELE